MGHPIKKQRVEDISEDNTNILKPLIFELFPKLQQITVVSSSLYRCFAFNLLSLLSVIDETVLPASLSSLVIKGTRPDKSGEWLKSVYCDESAEQFAAKNLWTKFQTEKNVMY